MTTSAKAKKIIEDLKKLTATMTQIAATAPDGFGGMVAPKESFSTQLNAKMEAELLQAELVYLGEDTGKKHRTLVILTADGAEDEKSTAMKMAERASKHGMRAVLVDVSKLMLGSGKNPVFKLGGKGTSGGAFADEVIVVIRGSALASDAGQAALWCLEQGGATCINRLGPSLMARNKLQSALHFAQEGIEGPETYCVTDVEKLDKLPEELGWPLVAKPLTGAEGNGITLVESPRALKSAVQNYLRMDKAVLLQKFMPGDRDFRALCLDGKVIAGAARVKGNGDFRSNKAQGGEWEPRFPEGPELAWCEKAARASGMAYVALDYVTYNGKHLLFEANGSPGSGAKYADKDGKEIGGDQLVDLMLSGISELKESAPRRSGLIEWVSVEGMDAVHCKMDTGNESYNSIHADDIWVEGGEDSEHANEWGYPNDEQKQEAMCCEGRSVTFKLRGKEFTRPLVSTVRVRAGQGAAQRPVVELDVVFDGDDHEKVRFNLTDRSEKEYEVLFGSKFMVENGLCVDPSKEFLLDPPAEGVTEVIKVHRFDGDKLRKEYRSLRDAGHQESSAINQAFHNVVGTVPWRKRETPDVSQMKAALEKAIAKGRVDAYEAVKRSNATRALRDFKTLMANLDPTVDVMGFEVEVDGVKVAANSNPEGQLTSLTLSGPGGKRLLRLSSGTAVDASEYEAKMAQCRVVKPS